MQFIKNKAIGKEVVDNVKDKLGRKCDAGLLGPEDRW